jgi:formiminotetrahydrofolate cyclodeaminase
MGVAIKNISLGQWLKLLAAKAPTPGGGSAAAVAGALAAALVGKVAGLTINKKGYEQYCEQFNQLKNQARQARLNFLELAEADAAAYEAVVSAYRNKGALRQKRIKAAWQKAAEVPLATTELAVEVLAMAKFCTRRGNKNALSDAQVAVDLARAAAAGGSYNVEINLESIEDKQFVTKIKRQLKLLLKKLK